MKKYGLKLAENESKERCTNNRDEIISRQASYIAIMHMPQVLKDINKIINMMRRELEAWTKRPKVLKKAVELVELQTNIWCK